MEQAKVPQFVADAMLGRLARWLRILGFDTLYFREIDDEQLFKLHAETGRVLLTRDTRMVRRRGIGVHVLVKSDGWEDQLREVAKSLSLVLTPERLLTRCLLCNRLLEKLSPDEAYGRIPDHVARSTSDFRGCESCGKVYWAGTHRRHITEVVARLGCGKA
jgi:uncharacterized protein with PIN domain